MSERIKNLAKELDSYAYFIWKDIHSVMENIENLENTIELDICVEPSQVTSLIEKLYLLGYHCYCNRIPKYKRDIYHAFLFFNGGYIHLHIYPGLITGNHFSKEYDLPMDLSYYNDCNVKYGLKFANKELELYLSAIRVNLKRSNFFFEKIKISDIENYYSFKRIDSTYQERFSDFVDNATTYRYKSVFKVIIENFYFRLIFPVETKLFKTSNKKMINSKKIAIIGTDGSGKSTICSNIYNQLRKKTPIKHIYLGSNFRNFSAKTWFNYLFYKAFFRFFKHTLTYKMYTFGLFEYEYSRLNDSRKKFIKALSSSNNGSFILFERFPIEGFLDFPKSLLSIDRKYLSKRQKRKLIEMSIFWKNAASEVEVFLITTPLDLITERRNMPTEELLDVKKKKVFESEFINKDFLGININVIENNKSLLDVLDEIYEKI
ncbi:hypothetical protein FCV87_18215 [Vibrio breoganii]|uniref:hypothetical protein n=1 Tax=Vibrio breoganii TaxID=553239 RepID=UPI0010BDF987|nr:hypothetical protein [Vibrio breoganii]TKG24510.1 hypothetical protein FCV87_18215 [Vibrio breoganii]